MRQYGLIGFPLGHSFSAGYFAKKFRNEGIDDALYSNFPIENIAQIDGVVNDGVMGFNVTIPYKEQILPYLRYIDSEAKEIGAVNCVKVENRELKGYNTDVYGFRESLLELIGNDRPMAMVLGTGGAAKAVEYVFKELGIEFVALSRTKGMTYDSLTEEFVSTHKLIVNTTPLGMYPNIETAPELPYSAIGADHYLFDLVYNPEITKLMSLCAQRGAKVQNGMKMLELQAERSWDIWNNRL